MDKKEFWNAAGGAGLVLGLVSVIFFAANPLVAKLPPVIAAVINAVLWLAKFVGCILLMQFFMKRFAAASSEVTNSDTFKFGLAVAMFSSLLYSASYLGYVVFINPDLIRDSINMALKQYSSLLDSNSLAAIEEMMPKLPSLTFFTNLVWCFMYGSVLSAILSRNIPSQNPFNE